MDTSALTLRPVTDAEHTMLAKLLANSFLSDPHEHWLPYHKAVFEPGRVLGVYDGTRLVGSAQVLSRQLTLPGPAVRPVAAVSAVAVAADHRRQGVLNRLMGAQLHGLHAEGREAFAALWATESRIYGRYGYGIASQYCAISLGGRTEFRPDVQLSSDPVRELPREDAMPLVTAIYDEVAPSRIGWLSRSAASWTRVCEEQAAPDHGVSSPRFAVHPEGYAIYRTRGGRAERGPAGQLYVIEVVARTPQAYARLWRYLLSMDLVASIEGRLGPDDPLSYLLADPNDAVRKHRPALWLRIVDLDRALTARTYSAPADLVVEVSDELCSWNVGRWRLRIDATATAEITRTDAEPDLAMDIVELGAAFLGGTRLTTLASAGRVRELTDGALATASSAFLAEQQPSCVETF